MTILPVRRALLSVSDKQGIVELAQFLVERGVELISTGGTSQVLAKAGIAHSQVEEITGLPAILDDRVKTLHPLIHGGILGLRDKHAQEAEEHGIPWIDLVVVNFYPFHRQTAEHNLSWEEAARFIDIGGPTMVRAAAKNFAWVGVLVNTADYANFMAAVVRDDGMSLELRQALAQKVFACTAEYEAGIANYFAAKEALTFPSQLQWIATQHAVLRYGENPHQAACAYQLPTDVPGILQSHQFQGKPLSFNNIVDAEAAVNCVRDFVHPCCVIVKHASPCGVATSATLLSAFRLARDADALSAFGGVVALNRICDADTAAELANMFLEVIIAPEFTPAALASLSAKKNLRLLSLDIQKAPLFEHKVITGGLLRQTVDQSHLADLNLQQLTCVTEKQLMPDDLAAIQFAWRVVKHVKSNAIVITNAASTLGIGGGQVSRVDAVTQAIQKSGPHAGGAVLASDAFFPFRDSIDKIAAAGIRLIVQPGGSVRDEEVIAACNAFGIAMVFTHQRVFRH